ncbi:hypothetical protein K1719_039816 [Acacia pycnantha]|nr:hypothetical protein K1719_039816 [Acacia pycnantha]
MSRVSWDDGATKALLEACMEQIVEGEGHGKKYSPRAWKYIVPTFNSKASKDYERRHLQRKLNGLWKLYGAWEQLLKEPGADKEDGTGNIFASGEWLTLDAEDKGSGDSEDDAFCDEPLHSTGVTDPMRGIGLKSIIPSAGNPGSRSRGKRKSEGSVEGRRNKRGLADALSIYRESPSVTFEQRDTSIDDALKVLDGVDNSIMMKTFETDVTIFWRTTLRGKC